MKKFLSTLLVLALALTPFAMAADLFPAVNSYNGFSDVPGGQWYTDAVKTCVETGLMNGTGGGYFTPTGTMTVAEAATIAARIREKVTGLPIPALMGSQAWYTPYVAYLHGAGIAEGDDPTAIATRQQFFSYLAAVVPADQLPAINAITALPDTSDANVLAFYNAGILTGTDVYGTFNAAGSLSRAECATMVARILRPVLRQTFTPQARPAQTAPSVQEEAGATTALMVNGQVFTLQEFVTAMDWIIFERESNLYEYTGQRLDWTADYGVGDLGTFFVDETLNYLVESAVKDQQARAFGTTADKLAQTLTPSPSREVLSAYAEGVGYLAAKHILLSTVDSPAGNGKYSDEQANTLAQQIIDAMRADPSMTQFNNLLALFNDDPGMTSNPDGYLFKSGEMVAEFEQATRNLSPGGFSQTPVRSTYGYHVILRLDPADLPQLTELYRNEVLGSLINTWVGESTVTANRALLSELNVQACYEQFFALLAAQVVG